ncbi:MAG TPA: endolytic transglycosylase MltG [Actinobacteria bacterium]|nr:endolytic transglycosylase MltG [Actinomycetota bacterium]
MSRRGRRDDDAYGDGSWLPGGGHGRHGEDDDRAGRRRPGGSGPHRRARGGTRTSQDSGSQTGPPWDAASPPWDQDQPGWDDSGALPRTDPADLTGGHPSGPLPPMRPDDHGWPEPPAASGYPGRPAAEPGYPGIGYPGYPAGEAGEDVTGIYPQSGAAGGGYPDPRDDDTGYGYAGYDEAGYEHPGHPGAGYPPGYPGTGGFPVADRGYPVTGGGYADTGTGYGIPAYHDDSFAGDAHDGGYPADDDGYLDYDEAAAGGRDRHGGQGYQWYADSDDEQSWADDDEDDDFLPGLSTAGRRGGDSRHRPPRGGKRPGKGKGGGKRKRGMRRVAPWLALGVLAILFLGVGGAGFYYYRTYLHPPDYSGPGTGSVIVRIHPGDTATTVGQRLQQLGVVASARAFANAAKNSGQGTALEPGQYRVHLHMQASLVFALLLKPSSRMQTKVTIPEGKRLSQIIAILGQDTGNLRGYQAAIKDVKALSLPSFAHGNPEGYLFPATYEVQPNTPPIKVLQQMVTAFDQEAASVSLPSAAAHAFLKQNEAITIASLIQAEGRNPADFPKIAEVIYNRLNSNPPIPLQLDSTVMYALHTYGIRASNAQTKVNSPYNTYQHTGLPPGPIDSPGDAAIKAALHPAHGGFLYFVTVDPKTGLTKFTSSFSQFQQFENELSANIAKGR